MSDQLTEGEQTASELTSKADKLINGDAKFFTRILNLIAIVISKGRMSMWLLITATSILCYFGKVTGDDCRILFTIYVCLAVGGEAIVGELISRYMGPPKGGSHG